MSTFSRDADADRTKAGPPLMPLDARQPTVVPQRPHDLAAGPRIGVGVGMPMEHVWRPAPSRVASAVPEALRSVDRVGVVEREAVQIAGMVLSADAALEVARLNATPGPIHAAPAAAQRDRCAAASRQRARRRVWGRQMRKAAADMQAMAADQARFLRSIQIAARDAAAQKGCAARRAALQARTDSGRKAYEQARWAAALAHEVVREPPRGVLEEMGEYHAGRAVVVPVLPDEPRFANRGEISSYLTEHAALNARIRTQHQVAHLVVSWAAETIHPGAAAATAARMCARIGIDPQRQRVVSVMHLDGKHAHMHILAARVRDDGGAWVPGLGVDRALALEASQLAQDHGQVWDQRMIARSARSGAAAAFAAKGELAGEIRYEDGERTRIAWQGPDVSARIDAGHFSLGEHAGVCVARLIGYRPADRMVRYAV